MILKNFKSLTFLLGVLVILSGELTAQKMGLANPASQNCVDEGGIVQITKRGDVGEYGICLFPDNRQCEEWAMFRGDCPIGGIKITGFLSPEGIYCALKGGEVLENETKCQLPSGKSCPTQDLYKGQCFDHEQSRNRTQTYYKKTSAVIA